MSGSGEDDRTPELARVTRAAQREFVPDDLDWDRMDEALFAKLDQVRADEAKRERASHRSKFVVVGAALAVAASALFYMKSHESLQTPDNSVAAVQTQARLPDVSSVVTRVQGELLVAGKTAAVGASMKPGDGFELRGRRAVFDSPNVATFMVDGAGTRGRVLQEGGSIALSLEDGAIEAEVIPDASPSPKERFSVTAGQARVSVRGTHLRVARAGRKVTVDLTRGSVAVGRELVSAPAHVELDSEDANAIIIDRLNVRPAESFDEVASLGPNVHPAPAKDATHALVPQPAVPAVPAPRLSPSAAAPIDPKARLEAAVKRCMLDYGFPENSPAAHLSLTTSLQMQVGDDGKVQSARFSPPLPPKAQDCAAAAAYGTKFGNGGAVTVSVQADK